MPRANEPFLIPLPDDLRAELARAAGDDNHGVPPFVSHVFRRPQGEIVGAVSLFAPTLIFWAHSTRVSKLEAVRMAKEAKTAGQHIRPDFLCACSPSSPFHPLMPGLGFQLIGNADYYET